MNLIEGLSDTKWKPFAESLGHSFWEGALVAVIVHCILRQLPAKRARERYYITVAGLGCILAAWFLTWAVLDHSKATPNSTVEPSSLAHFQSPVASLESEHTPESSTAMETPKASRNQIQGWLLLLWIIGVDLLLLKLHLAFLDLKDLRAQSKPPTNPQVLTLFEQLRFRSQTPRAALRVHTPPDTTGPIAFGLFRPTIIIPLSLATQAPPVLLEAILAHELAHLRRHDYLINLGQNLIEMLLFFNPAVWWLSQQIRHEREACCDQQATQLLGDETRYAEALADYASTPGSNPASLAVPFGERNHRGSLLERIRRLLIPNYRPQVRLPATSLVAFVLGSLLLLLLLHQGSRAAVRLGAVILTPKERIEQIATIQATHPNQDRKFTVSPEKQADPESKVRLSGSIKTRDGGPLKREGISILTSSNRPRSSYHSVVGNDLDHFETRIVPGIIHLSVKSPHYAPALIGPMEGIPGTAFTLDVQLARGFSSTLKFIDHDGNPVPSAQLSATYDFPTRPQLEPFSSDAHGKVNLQNLADCPIEFEFRHPGFQQETRTLSFHPNDQIEWKVTRAKPTTIRVIDENGQPIPNATARLVGLKGEKNVSYGLDSTTQVTLADHEGKIRFDQMHSDGRYWYVIEAPGFGKTLLEDLRAGGEERRIILTAPIDIQLIFRGDLRLLPQRTIWKDAERSKVPTIRYRNPIRYEGYEDASLKTLPVQIEGNEAHASLPNLWPGTLTISVAGLTQDYELETVHNPIVIALEPDKIAEKMKNVTAPALVRVTFDTPPGQPLASGPVEVVLSGKTPPDGRERSQNQFIVNDGFLEFEVNPEFQVSINPNNFTGYWFPSHTETITADTKTSLEIRLPCIPAGAIYGTIREETGGPAHDATIRVIEVTRGPRPNLSMLGVTVKDSKSPNDLTEQFNATPLPLGGSYQILAQRGNTLAYSPIITLTEETPIVSTSLTMQKGIDIRGSVVIARGISVPGIRFTHTYRTPEGHEITSAEQESGAGGRFHLQGVVPDLPGTYSIQFRNNPGQQGLHREYQPDGTPIHVQLKAGHQIEGLVIDSHTGWPIPGMEVYALPSPWSADRAAYLDADTKTDAAGRFKFTTLDSGDYKLHVREGKTLPAHQGPINALNNPKTQLRVVLAEWSDLVPKPPTPRTEP